MKEPTFYDQFCDFTETGGLPHYGLCGSLPIKLYTMKLQVVKTNKGYVAVSDFKDISKGDRYYNLKSKMFLDHDYEDLTSLTENDVKIIATDTSFKLEGIPQFELEKKEYNTSLEEEASDYSDILCKIKKMSTGEWCYSQRGYIDGYKAAQEKSCYTEEDMRKAINEVFNIVFKNNLLIKEDSERITYDVIDSLKQPKKLVAIEFDSAAIAGYTQEGDTCVKEMFKIVKSEEYPDGLLTIKQYFYE